MKRVTADESRKKDVEPPALVIVRVEEHHPETNGKETLTDAGYVDYSFRATWDETHSLEGMLGTCANRLYT